MTSLRVATVPLPELVEGSAQDFKNGMGGRFFGCAQNDMLCKNHCTMCRSYVGTNYRAQKTDVKVGRTFLSARIIDLLSE